MAAVFNRSVEVYNYYIYEVADHRTADTFLFGTPFPVIFLVVSYLYFVKVLGPRLMRDRQPFQLEGFMKIYNIAQILANLYVLWKGIQYFSHEMSDWRCLPIVTDDSEYAMLALNAGSKYVWLKIADFMDTIFFVLRKKNAQVTFLHVYHHAMIVASSWVFLKYFPGGNAAILPFVNVFVHAIMYSYYLLTSFDSEYKKSIWWKIHITQLQMVQFIVIIVFMSQTLFWNPCGYPAALTYIVMSQNIFMVVLFYDFYRKAYGKKKKLA